MVLGGVVIMVVRCGFCVMCVMFVCVVVVKEVGWD